MSPVESLHSEACDPAMELRRNKLELRFLYRLKSNSTYTESLHTLDDREDQNYVSNKGATKQIGVHLRKLEKGYIKEQRKLEQNHLAQLPPSYTSVMMETHLLIMTMLKNNTFYSIKKGIKLPNKLTQIRQRA